MTDTPHIQLPSEDHYHGSAPCGCFLNHGENNAPAVYLCPTHDAAPAMRAALEKIGQLIDNASCDPVCLLKKISRIQQAAFAQIEGPAPAVPDSRILLGTLKSSAATLDALCNAEGVDRQELFEAIDAVSGDIHEAINGLTQPSDETATLIVELDGGLVQDVYTDRPMRYVVVDKDAEMATEPMRNIPGLGDAVISRVESCAINPALVSRIEIAAQLTNLD